MLKMEEFFLIRDLYDQGLKISQIARETGFDRKTIRKYVNAEAPPIAKPRARKPSKLDDYKDYIQSRLSKCPLTAARVYREIQQLGFTGKYTIVRDYVQSIRPMIGVADDPNEKT